MTRSAVVRTPSRRSGARGFRRWIVTLVVVVLVLVGIDTGARAVAQNVMAGKIEQQGLSTKPDVTIDGFPFLTQVASRDFSKIGIKISDLAAGPVVINSISATATGVRVNSFAFSSGTIGSLNGTAFISFSSLGNTLVNEVGPLGSLLKGAGLQLTDAGPDEVRATLNLLVSSGTATWRVTMLSANRLNVHLIGSSGLPSSLLGSIQDVTLQIPRLPLGLTIGSIRVTPSGIVGQVTGQNVPFGS